MSDILSPILQALHGGTTTVAAKDRSAGQGPPVASAPCIPWASPTGQGCGPHRGPWRPSVPMDFGGAICPMDPEGWRGGGWSHTLAPSGRRSTSALHLPEGTQGRRGQGCRGNHERGAARDLSRNLGGVFTGTASSRSPPPSPCSRHRWDGDGRRCRRLMRSRQDGPDRRRQHRNR
jgi:hypothetical protein